LAERVFISKIAGGRLAHGCDVRQPFSLPSDAPIDEPPEDAGTLCEQAALEVFVLAPRETDHERYEPKPSPHGVVNGSNPRLVIPEHDELVRRGE
jgi:hypothetical protein